MLPEPGTPPNFQSTLGSSDSKWGLWVRGPRTEPQSLGLWGFLGARHQLEEPAAASLGCTKVSQAAELGRRDASWASI